MAYLNTAFNINVKLKHVVIGLKQIRKKYFFLFSFQDTYFKMGYRIKKRLSRQFKYRTIF